MSHPTNKLFGVMIVALTVTLSACGGGSGGSSGQAVLDADSAQAFASRMAGAGPSAQTDSIPKISKGTATSKSVTLSGESCGVGEMVQTVDYDVETEIFSGTVEFIDFRPIEVEDCLLYMNGVLKFSGTSIEQVGTYQDFEITYGIVSQVMNGDQTTIYSAGTADYVITQDMDVLDKNDGVDYHYNLTTSVTGSTGPGINEITDITGRLSSQVLGYADVTTTIPIESSTSDFTYFKGQLRFDGASGSQALLTYVSGGFTLDIDSDGDGVFETSKTCDWLAGCI